MKQFDPGQLADDLQNLVHHAEELLRATASSAGETASDARERAEESLSALRSKLASFEKDLKGRAKAVDSYVQDNPWTAVAAVGGIALIVGIIMGMGRK